MRPWVFAALAAASVLTGTRGDAGTPVTQTMTCPIGGASFEFKTTASYSTSGERPDGKPYGSWTFPLALPECPDNGLVLYKEYDAGEIAKLEPLIASEAYQALRKEDTQYYRAYWLMREMGLGPERYLWALLQAAWEADARPELRARYLAELAEKSGAVEPRPTDLNWVGMEGRAINALRELGRFDEALARLEKLPLATLQADSRKDRQHWAAWFRNLRPLIERKDSSSEPFEMIPRNLAVSRCIEQVDTLDETRRGFCEKEATAVAELKAARQSQEEELQALQKSREQSGR
jgi:hypothetical protein